jgi:hypothetical protein
MSILFYFLLLVVSCLQSKSSASLQLSFVDPSGQPVQSTIDEQDSEATAGSTYQPNLRLSNADGKIEIVTDDSNTERCCFVYAQGFAIDLLNTSFSHSRSMRVGQRCRLGCGK